MKVPTKCPHCGHEAMADERRVHTWVECPKCKTPFVIERWLAELIDELPRLDLPVTPDRPPPPFDDLTEVVKALEVEREMRREGEQSRLSGNIQRRTGNPLASQHLRPTRRYETIKIMIEWGQGIAVIFGFVSFLGAVGLGFHALIPQSDLMVRPFIICVAVLISSIGTLALIDVVRVLLDCEYHLRRLVNPSVTFDDDGTPTVKPDATTIP